MPAGTSKMQVKTTVRSAGLLPWAAPADTGFLLALQFPHTGVEPVEVLFPKAPVVADPFRGVLERRRLPCRRQRDAEVLQLHRGEIRPRYPGNQ